MKFYNNFAKIIKQNKDNIKMGLYVFVPATLVYGWSNNYDDTIHLRYLSYIKSQETSKLLKEAKYDWQNISKTDSSEAVELCKKYPNKVFWDDFSKNESEKSVKLCIKNIDRISMYCFSRNKSPVAVQFCIDNPELIDWMGFSSNESPVAMQYCRENINKVYWGIMIKNKSPEAARLCSENSDSIKEYWRICRELSQIPNI